MKTLLIAMAGLACAALGGCKALQNVNGTVFYRDADSGAKAGLSYGADGPSTFVRVPIYNARTGALRGIAGAELGRRPVVIPAK